MPDFSPINYGALQTQIDLSGLQRGLQLRTANRTQQAETKNRTATLELAQQKFAYDQKQDGEYKAAVQAYRANPTAEGLRDLQFQYPDQSERVAKAADSYSSSQKQDLIGSVSSAVGALSAGKPEVAKQVLRDRAKALQNAGIDSSHTQGVLDLIDKGDVKGATAAMGFALGGLIGWDHAGTLFDTLGIGAKVESTERRLDLDAKRVDIADRRADASIAQGNARVDLSRAAGARAERKANQPKGGGKKGGKGGYSNADLDALLQ